MKEFHENKQHGAPEFPFVVYPGNLPGYLTSYPLHWHEEMELIYVVSGSGSITVQAEHLTVHTGDMVLIPPQRVHSIEQLESHTMVYFTILFHLSMLDSEYTREFYGHGKVLPYYLPKSDPLNETIREPVLELVLNRSKVNSDFSLMIRAHLYTLLYHIIHDCPATEETTINRHMNYDRLKVVLENLRENYAQETSVEEAAAMCGFSASHFMKLFRELTGTSYTQYVKNLRLDTAARLLRTTSMRISDVAEAVGFRNLPYFTRAFGSKFHMSPLSYRENK